MGSRGSQNPNWQRWIPKPITLAEVTGTSGNSKDVTFRVPFPDSRLRVKISLLFKFKPNSVPSGGPSATLWLSENDVDDSGQQGDNVPLANIIPGVTSAAPLAIPVDAGLSGYTREFVSAADYVEGRLRVLGNGAFGYWVLQTRYQPYSVSFSPEEWGLITSNCNPEGVKILVP